MRLIDADALKEKVVHYSETEYHFDHDAVEMDDIDGAPTIDAVQVVRCRYCEYWNKHNECGLMDMERTYGWDDFDKHTKPDWFCASGKRRSET